MNKTEQLFEAIETGSYRALARGITIVENELEGYDWLLRQGNENAGAPVIGVTGPPGAGKSTLVNALLGYWLGQHKKVAVVAVDPSSPFNYGALLGDRIRMSDYYNHPDIYIRSLASRGALGGLSAKIIEITSLIRTAPFDIIIVETVGVGQSEVEIAGLADCTVVVLVPEAGDEVQTLKAGIMEIADIFVVNKADHEHAETLYRNLRMMTHERANGGFETPVLKTIATTNEGIAALSDQILELASIRNGVQSKKFDLLVEKSWQLIQSKQMKHFNIQILKSQLKEVYTADPFNLYQFTEQFMETYSEKKA